MNKKEILEIRKQLSKPEQSAITRLCACYVDHEKNKVFETKTAFLSLPDEEAFKYHEIFKKTLSGSLGKNLLEIGFPLSQEEEGGTQEFLLKLRNSKLKDDELLDDFYNNVITNFEYAENYYIILIHSSYDVPGRTKDGFENFDASDEVYESIMCSICPVKLSKPGLSYDSESNSMNQRERDWMVEAPINGFLFPAFNDRCADIHSIMYYSKNPSKLGDSLIDAVIGSDIPLSSPGQKTVFNDLISGTFSESCDYETIRSIHENINELLEENKENPDPVMLSKEDIRKVFEEADVAEENIQSFEKAYVDVAGEHTNLQASNITETKFSIQTPDIVIKVNPARTDLIESRIIDGRQCLVIAVDDHIKVNGVDVKTIGKDSIS